jgi:hypothetical protein
MRILILAPPGVQSLDVVGPAEVFWEAARRLGDENAYRIEIVGTQAGPIPGTGSLRFLPDRTIDDPTSRPTRSSSAATRGCLRMSIPG